MPVAFPAVLRRNDILLLLHLHFVVLDLRLVCSKSGVKFPRGLAVVYDLRQMPAVLYLVAVSVLIGAFFAVKLGDQAVVRLEARLFAHCLRGLQNVLRRLSFRFLSTAATERKK